MAVVLGSISACAKKGSGRRIAFAACRSFMRWSGAAGMRGRNRSGARLTGKCRSCADAMTGSIPSGRLGIGWNCRQRNRCFGRGRHGGRRLVIHAAAHMARCAGRFSDSCGSCTRRVPLAVRRTGTQPASATRVALAFGKNVAFDKFLLAGKIPFQLRRMRIVGGEQKTASGAAKGDHPVNIDFHLAAVGSAAMLAGRRGRYANFTIHAPPFADTAEGKGSMRIGRGRLRASRSQRFGFVGLFVVRHTKRSSNVRDAEKGNWRSVFVARLADVPGCLFVVPMIEPKLVQWIEKQRGIGAAYHARHHLLRLLECIVYDATDISG